MTPLAEQLRPQNLDNFLGQQHLIGENKPITLMLESGNISSMIFWGPSGVGKTTLARIIASNTKANFIELSAVKTNVKELREVLDIPNDIFNRQTILFLDEIHHFNKSQQDLLLPYLENGTITLIGATTENPAFSLNNALLSRCQVYIFEKISNTDLTKLIDKYIKVDDIAKQNILRNADGDTRKLINIIEGIQTNNPKNINEFLASFVPNFDNSGDIHYQLLSALHKSIRGSHADAALLYFAKLITSGANPKVVARRLLAIASEDVGLADPRALTITLNAWDIYHRVGDKEGLRVIGEAVVYLALAPKSNALYSAFNKAMDLAKDDNSSVPKNLINSNTKLDKEQGYGDGYKYAHNYSDGIEFEQEFMPKGLEDMQFYHPVNRGLEIKLKEKLDKIRILRK